MSLLGSLLRLISCGDISCQVKIPKVTIIVTCIFRANTGIARKIWKWYIGMMFAI